MTTRRLLDDPDIGAQLRADLEEMASFDGPPYDVERGIARLESRVEPEVVAGTGRGRWLRRALPAAFVLGGTTLAAAAVSYSLLSGPAEEPSQRGVSQLRSATTPAVRSAQAAEAEAEAEAEPVASGAAPVEQAETPPRASAQGNRPAPAPATSRLTEPSRDELLRREVAHLAQVRQATAGNPARAVRLANEGHRAFAGGALYVEREALAITALAKLGRRGEARMRGERLLKAFPRSPYAEQIRRQTGLQ